MQKENKSTRKLSLTKETLKALKVKTGTRAGHETVTHTCPTKPTTLTR